MLETVKNKSVDYEYNELNQLVKKTTSQNEVYIYSYDKRGNRTAETDYDRDYAIDYTSPENGDLYIYAMAILGIIEERIDSLNYYIRRYSDRLTAQYTYQNRTITETEKQRVEFLVRKYAERLDNIFTRYEEVLSEFEKYICNPR